MLCPNRCLGVYGVRKFHATPGVWTVNCMGFGVDPWLPWVALPVSSWRVAEHSSCSAWNVAACCSPHACAGQVMTSRQATEWSAHVAETAAETGLSGTNGLFEVRRHPLN